MSSQNRPFIKYTKYKPLTKYNILEYLENNFKIWTSGNENIDNFIQEMQLKFNYYPNAMLEWIPYNQFNEVKEMGKNGLITVYSAIWKDGPLCYSWDYEYIRDPNKKVALKILHDLQNPVESLINEV
jgi:hypothetical protein